MSKTRSLDELKEWPDNYRRGDVDRIAISISRFGFNGALRVRGDTVFAGNHQLKALRKLKKSGAVPPRNVVSTPGGEWLVPVITIDHLSEQEAIAFALADNRTQELGSVDEEQLANLLAELDATTDLVPATGYDEDELTRLLGEFEKEQRASAPADTDVICRADELQKKWKCRIGQMWELGNGSRLLCGDSTSAEDVARLFGGVPQAALFATDPPYGVSFSSTKDGIPGSGYANHKELYGDIAGDQFRDDELQKFLTDVFLAWVPHLRENAAWYLWHAHLTQGFFAAAAAAAAAAVILHRQIIWLKPSMVLTRSGMYHWKHEPCFFGWRQGHQPPWFGDKSQTSVWGIGRESDGVHPTQKPLDVFNIPMQNHTLHGDIVAEPFAGSGTQIIAAEASGRRCMAMEIDPKYCAAILERCELSSITVTEVTEDDQPKPRKGKKPANTNTS